MSSSPDQRFLRHSTETTPCTPLPYPPLLRVLVVCHLSKHNLRPTPHQTTPRNQTSKTAAGGRRNKCSPVVTASVLSHVHQLLAEYFLHQGSPGRGLDHFSELMACTTNEDARRQLVNEFRRTDDYHRATADLTHSSVEAMLDDVRALLWLLLFRCRALFFFLFFFWF